jgi:hypothetical protein
MEISREIVSIIAIIVVTGSYLFYLYYGGAFD